MELAFTLDDSGTEPLHRQLYAEVRNAILCGRLLAGQKLPSTRTLAQSLSVSRTTVAQSYDQLLEEGYLETRRGAGTFVSEQIPDALSQCQPTEIGSAVEARQYRLSRFAQNIAQEQQRQPTVPEGAIYFRYGHPTFDALPWRLWKHLMIKHCQPGPHILDYSHDWRGHEPLRNAIASYLNRSRAVKCSSDQVIIVSGAQQALDLCTRLFVSPEEQVVIEDPAYPGARKIFQAGGAQLLPVPVDEAGLITGCLPRRSESTCKFAYVTPSHQFPTGAVMSLPRRLDLLGWAKQNDAIIVEDDYDSEFRYSGRPVPSLQGLDSGASVIYIGTFSKVLFPGLRLAYVVVPEALVPLFAQAKWLADRQCPMLEQCVLAEFIESGHLERHIRRMRTLYDGLRRVLVRSLVRSFGDRISVLGDSTGLHILVRVSSKYRNDELLKRAKEEGVVVTDARVYYHGSGGTGEYLLGYTDLTAKEIQEGVRRFARAAK